MNLDLYALLSYDCPDVLNEFFTIRADDHKLKRQVINDIVTTGKAYIPEKTQKGTSSELMDIFMTGLGLAAY